MPALNQYSYIVISLAALVVGMVILRLCRIHWRYTILTGIAIASLSIAGGLLLQPGANDVPDIQQANATLNNGRPTLLEFFSNYCASCLAIRPSVDLLTHEFTPVLDTMRIDIHSDLGQQLREQIGFSYTPEFVLFDATGREVERQHTIPTHDQLFSLTHPQQP